MRTSGRCRWSATLTICTVSARASRRRQNYCQTDHENLCHFNLSNKTTQSCHLFNTAPGDSARGRSEEHTSELQSRRDLVCRLLLEKKKIKERHNNNNNNKNTTK